MSAARAAILLTALWGVVGSVSADDSKQTSAVETAKRDLQALPKTPPTIEGMQRKSLFPGGSALPSLAPASPSPAPSQSEEKSTATKTGEWLLDGLNQLEADSKNTRAQQRPLQEPRDAWSEASDKDSAVSPINPFADYLTRWMRPEDHRLLVGEAGRSSPSVLPDWSGPRPEAGAMGSARISSPNPTVQTPEWDLSGNGQPPGNPYLNSSVVVDAPRLLPDTSSPKTDGPSALAPVDQPTVFPMQSPTPRIEQPPTVPVVPPTTRLIDDRKYFPQLRRF